MVKQSRPSTDATRSGAPRPPEPAILIGQNEDQRRLLRGLLLMHHQPIALEAPSLESMPDRTSGTPARILVYVAPSESDRWSEELRGTLEARPELSALVLLPLDEPSTRSSAARAGARAVLGRPFTSREFFEAVDGLTPKRAPPSRARVSRSRSTRPR
ncbi:MAG TPA: hypothetical protein VML94_05785 [Thermoplasmata archaeon]|nr:hypothetical protein [Thermoplasmata archaeon]